MWLNLFLLFLFTVFEKSISAGRISMIKCEEYSKAVFSQQPSPVLLPNSKTDVVSDCGIVEVPLVIGGLAGRRKEFPHMSLVGFGPSANAKLSWQCGGALVSDRFVLTAAHCLHSREKGPAQKVKFGVVDLTQQVDSLEVLVSARIPHPQYRPPEKYNDIALLKLVDSVKFSPFVRPACLNFNQHLATNKAIAIGFGKISYDAPSGSDILMKVQLSLIPNSQCAQSFSTGAEVLSMPRGITDSMVCAGEMDGGKDTCQGDSGGPLQIVLEKPYCMYSIVGITSFGKFCGFANSPAIYTNVFYFLDWIEKIVWG